MDRLYDSNLILNNVYDGTGLTLRQDTNEILNAIYDSGNNALKVNIQNLPSGSTSAGVSASNEILINVVDDAVIGKQYKTFADAFAYIVTQTPSATNTFAIRFSGKIAESIMVPEFVTVVGNDMYTSIIGGVVSFSALGNQLLNTNNISNCTITSLVGTSELDYLTGTTEITVPYVPTENRISFSSIPTTGTFTITIGTFTTAAITYNATAQDIQDAITVLDPSLELIFIDDYIESTQFTIKCYGMKVSSSDTTTCIGVNIDLDAGITLSVNKVLGTTEEQTISFTEVGYGMWLLSLVYNGNTYTCTDAIVNNEGVEADILVAINDIFSQIYDVEGIALGNKVEISGDYDLYTIIFKEVLGDLLKFEYINVDLVSYTPQYIGVDNCKILSVLGTGSNGLIANNCMILGGDFSTFDSLCFISNSYIFGFSPVTLKSARFFSCFIYVFAPGTVTLNGCDFNSTRCSGFDKVTLLGNTLISNCLIEGGMVISSIVYAESSDFKNNVRVDSTGVLQTKGCVANVTPIVAGGTWTNIGDSYDNRISGLVATNVQTAIDEISGSEIGLVNRYYVGVNGDFQTIDEANIWLKDNMISPSELLLDCGDYYINDQITIVLPYHLNVRGTDFQSCNINASSGLTNKPMFVCLSSVSFERVTFNGSTLLNYGTLTTESAIVLSSQTYTELKALEITGFYNGINIIGANDIFVFDSIFTNISGSGILVNSPGLATDIDVEVNTFENCGNAINLNETTAGNFHLMNNIFNMSNSGQSCIRYNPTNYILTNDPVVLGNTWNNVGEFYVGFDFTRSDGRDANIFVISNSGKENKNAHGKINLINNTGTTTIGTPTTFYKASFTNGITYTCKLTLANNRVTYQPKNKTDLMMWVSCNVISTQQDRNIDIAIVKNGNTALGLFGQMTVRVTVQSQPFPISTPAYIPDVVLGDYFEIWVTNSGTGNVIVQDVSWLIDSK